MVRDSDLMFDRMYQQIMCILALNTREQALTWQYILVSYCHLEALALELLRLHQGTGEQTFWEGPDARKNLNGVATQLKPLVSPEIIQILKAVATLRNSVAHKSLLGGITAGQKVRERIICVSYQGNPVFDDQYIQKSLSNPEVSGVNEETLERLATDVDSAIAELNRLRQIAERPQTPC